MLKSIKPRCSRSALVHLARPAALLSIMGIFTTAATADSAVPSGTSNGGSITVARVLLTLLILLILTGLFFRSVLPRVPRIFLRGRLRINRAGIRGIRGIEWRSRGFKTTSANWEELGASTNGKDEQLHVRIQRIYAVFRRPQWKRHALDEHTSSSGSRSLLTIHVQGVGVRLPPSKNDEETLTQKMAKLREEERRAEQEAERCKREENERLEKLMNSPVAESSQPSLAALANSLQTKSFARAAATDLQAGSTQPASSIHKASVMSLHTVLQVGSWLRYTAFPALRNAALRLIRAALFVVTSSLPSLTSLIDVQVHRIELYAQEAETVVRIGRAGISFSMAVVSTREQVAKGEGVLHHGDLDQIPTPSWRELFRTAARMPTRIGSGAKGAASYLVGGLPAGHARVRLRIEGVQVFEADFPPHSLHETPRAASLSRFSFSPVMSDSSRPTSPTSSQPQQYYQHHNHPQHMKHMRRRTATFVRPDSSSGYETSPHLAASEDTSFEWPETGSPRPMSPGPGLKRSNSVSMLGAMSGLSLSGFTDRWADWALEPLADSDFSTDTGWARRHSHSRGPGAGQRNVQIPESARLLCLAGVSELGLGLLFGSSFNLKAKEMVDISINMCETTVGLDAVLRVMSILEEKKARRPGPKPTIDGLRENKRSLISKHLAQQDKSLPVTALRLLSSFSFAVPSVHVNLSPQATVPHQGKASLGAPEAARLPPPMRLQAQITGFHFELGSSSPSDAIHQQYFGACGVKDHKHSRETGTGRRSSIPSSQPDVKKASSSVKKRRVLIEHRRAFAFDLGLGSFEVFAGFLRNQGGPRSELAFLGDLSVTARSTWTPFGLMPSANDLDDSTINLFRGDPNEEGLVLQAAIGQIRGDTRLDHLTALLGHTAVFKARRAAVRSRLGIDELPRPKTQLERLVRFPKFSAGFEVGQMSYTLDASTDEQVAAIAHEERKIIFSVPHVSATFGGDYHDEYVKRPEAEKRAAYKALKRDQLEWALQDQPPPKSFRETIMGAKSVLTREPETINQSTAKSSHNDAGSSESNEEPSVDTRYSEEGLSMDEALRRMSEIQNAESKASSEAHDPPSRRSTIRDAMAKTGKVRLPGYTRRSSMAAETLFSLRYQFETHFEVEAVEVFLSLSGDRTSSRRGFYQPMPGMQAPSVGSSQHHLLALHTFELTGTGGVPGNVIRDHACGSLEVPWLSLPDAVADFRASVEDIDVELWHPAALQAYVFISDSITQAKVPFDPAVFGKSTNKDRAGSGLPKEQPTNEDESPKEEAALIDRLPGGLNIYLSIGSTIAHLGGTDARSDSSLTRGIGLESKRLVFEYSAISESKNNAAQQKLGWGARSALELPEDLRLQATSLAARHRKVALARVILFEIGLFPILDAAQATQQHMEGTAEETFARAKNSSKHGWPQDEAESSEGDVPSSESEQEGPHRTSAIFAPAVWEFHARGRGKKGLYKTERRRPRFRQQDRSNFILWVPFAAFKAAIRPPYFAGTSKITKERKQAHEEVTITSEDVRLLAFKIDLLHTYCILLTIATLRSLVPKKPPADAIRKEGPVKPKSSTTLAVKIDVGDVHVSVTLPRYVHLFLRLRRLEVRKDLTTGISVSFESIMGLVESPHRQKQGVWEEAVRLRDWKITIPNVKDEEERRVEIHGDGALIRIPFGYQVFQIIDNTTVAIKTTKQLVYQFLTGKDDSIIIPVAEGPKRIPRISLDLRILTIEAQDDPMETRLNIIWRAGGDENRAREERESAFQTKVASLLSLERNKSMASFVGSEFSFSSSSSSSSDDLGQNDSSKVSIEEARAALDAFNSSSWIRRYRNARAEQGRREDTELRRISGRYPMQRNESDLPIRIAPLTRAAPLFRSTMFRISLEVSAPPMNEDQLRDFIHDQGGGIPRDTQFSLFVPIHMRWQMNEWRVNLRDYPMPLLHVPPPSKSKQPESLRSWDLEADFCLAEQLGGPESIRHVPAVVVPAATGHPDALEYGIIVPKVAMPVKFYGSSKIQIQSSLPTRVVWGQSIQPTIQDVTRVIDGITSPPHDPSPKIGFWDKVPLVAHGKLLIKFVGEGDFNLHMKGSRDPYQIMGQAAGWVKCWRGGVELRIGYPNEDKEFFQILSHEYILAIPDLKDYIDNAATGAASSANELADHHEEGHKRKSYDPSVRSASSSGYMKDPTFEKVVVKLTNGVKWGSGLMMERTCDDETCPRTPRCEGEPFYRECRNFERIPHWKVVTKTREHFDSLPESERKDSYRGWRSQHIHFSLSVFSPESGLPGFCSKAPRKDVSNNFYLTPLVSAHFWAWMRLFNGAMGLPIRNGSLFPDSPPPSPKFGRHLGTIKYRLDLQPLFISHQYRQFSKADLARGLSTFLGLKARLGSFRLDLHQRQQETIKDRPELGGHKIVLHKPFYETEVDCDSIDLRTLAGQFSDPSQKLALDGDEEDDLFALDEMFEGDCTIPDRDLEWIDLDDFSELGNRPLGDARPKITLYPLLVCPKFNYYRKRDSEKEKKARDKARERKRRAREYPCHKQASSNGTGGKDAEGLSAYLEHSKFGNEPSHPCLVGKGIDPYMVQRELARERLNYIRSEIDRLLSSPKPSSPSTSTSSSSDDRKLDDEESNATQLRDFQNRERLVVQFIAHLTWLREQTDTFEKGQKNGHSSLMEQSAFTSDLSSEYRKLDLPSLYRDMDLFDNRYFAHNPTIFFTNTTRTILLKYYYSSRMRRGYCHHMTATAVRYIRELATKTETSSKGSASHTDLLDEIDDDRGHKFARPLLGGQGRRGSERSKMTDEQDEPASILQDLLDDALRYVETETKDGSQWSGCGEPTSSAAHGSFDPKDGISDEFDVKKSNICVLLKPQIVLKSEVDDKSTVIITAILARLQNYTVRDDTCAEDSVNEVVLRRNFFSLDSLQVFQPSRRCRFLKNASERYGFVFVPLETMVDLRYETKDFDRIVPRTDAIMHYDKFNKLRISDSSRSVAAVNPDGDPKYDHLYHHMDVIRLKCPRFSVSANSKHFGSLYNVVTDLILYRDPAYKEHAKRLEEKMFNHDYTDVSGLADLVSALQIRIRQTTDLVDLYRINLDRLTERGRLEFLSAIGELFDLVKELNLIMEAITTAQDSKGGADREKKSALRFDTYAQDVAWNMMGEDDGEVVAKLSVKGISFTWLNKADNSAANTVSIVDLQALNVHPEAVFPEIITKHHKATDHPMAKQGRFMNAMWSVLPPVGGIAIIDLFELHLHPVRIQIEMRVGRQIMDYIFGSKREREKQEDELRQIEHRERKKEQKAVASRIRKSAFARLLPGGRKNQKDEDSSSSMSRSTFSSRNASNSDLASLTRPSVDSSRSELQDADDDDAHSQHSGRRKAGSKHQLSISTSANKDNSRSRPATPASKNAIDSDGDDKNEHEYAIASRNAQEMRSRAAAYRTFVYVQVPETIFSLSYKGEKQKSITDLYDLVFRTPTFEYRNCTFGYVDLAENFKKDVFKAAWGQKTTLLKEILTHRPQRKRTAIGNLKSIRQASKTRETLNALDITVQPPTPSETRSVEEDMVDSPIDRDDDDDDDGDAVSLDQPVEPAVNIVTTPSAERDHADSLDEQPMLAIPSTTAPASTPSPSFKLGRFLSRNFRPRSGSGSSLTIAMSRNGSGSGGATSLSPSSSNSSTASMPRQSDLDRDRTVRASRRTPVPMPLSMPLEHSFSPPRDQS